jgi:SulP family sulfate permease
MIGDHTFVGFKAIVHDSIVGEGCFIGHNALVVGVEIPPGKRVPSGWVVDSPEKVAQLPPVEDAHAHFNEDVVQVNRGLVMAYARHDAAPPESSDDHGLGDNGHGTKGHKGHNGYNGARDQRAPYATTFLSGARRSAKHGSNIKPL